MNTKSKFTDRHPNIYKLYIKTAEYIGKDSIFDHGRTALNFLLYLATLAALIMGIVTIYNYNLKFSSKKIEYVIVQQNPNDTSINEAGSLSIEKEQVSKTIDLLNLVLVTGGSVVVFVSILAVLQVRKWDTQHKNAENHLLNAELKFKEATAEYGDIEIYQKWLFEVLEFFTVYARGLSKFYSHNYEDAIRQFNYVIHFVNEKMTFAGHEKDNMLDDVYFHLGRSYFKQVNIDITEKSEENIAKLIKAYESFETAKNIFLQSSVPNFSSGNNAKANCAVILAYLSAFCIDDRKKNHYMAKCLQYVYDIENYLNNKVLNVTHDKKPIESIAPMYNLGCTYAVLYKYEKDEMKKLDYRIKALTYAEKSYKSYSIVNQDYFLNDKDWDVFTAAGTQEPDRIDFAEKVGPFFAKKNSRWEIAKIWIEIFDMTGNEKFKYKAEELIDKCIRTHLITNSDINNSSTIKNLENKSWRKHILSEWG